MRPLLSRSLSGSELRRWYWTKAELALLGREFAISTSVGKLELTNRLAAALDGAPPPAPPEARSGAPGQQLAGPLTPDVLLPRGQRCSQELRRFFTDQVGPRFRFDAAMRQFVADGAGLSLGDGVRHWYRTRSLPRGDIDPQFELNQFIRDFHARKAGSREMALAAWRRHKELPRSPVRVAGPA
jgi:hypothetical protein